MNPRTLASALCVILAACNSTARPTDDTPPTPTPTPTPTSTSTQSPDMNLGAFSVSLAVKDLAASREFYGKLGFEPFAGDPAQNWQILRNGEHVIGLFQGMFPNNIMTFNPGWTQQATPLDEFTDVRDLQNRLEQRGVTLIQKADANTSGPASLTMTDPDGNVILIDQHVPSPK